MKPRKWIKVENGIITDIHRSSADQSFFMKEIPWNSDVKTGENINWYNKNYKRISDNELVKAGLRIDNRGWYWNKDNYKHVLKINRLDILIPEGFNSMPPIKGEPCIWAGDKWVIDEAEKNRLKSILPMNEVQNFVSGLVGNNPDDINETIKLIKASNLNQEVMS